VRGVTGAGEGEVAQAMSRGRRMVDATRRSCGRAAGFDGVAVGGEQSQYR